jgi:glyoxylase-like metal-dependent hydrolase (beta-lactamase superfamily II)
MAPRSANIATMPQSLVTGRRALTLATFGLLTATTSCANTATVPLAAQAAAQTSCPPAGVTSGQPTSRQAPGYYRTKVGDFDLVALHDGNLAVPSSLLRGDPSDIAALLRRGFVDPKVYNASGAAFLVTAGDRLVLIDTGTGGGVVEALKAARYQPEQVDVVLLTHMHPDHVGGLTAKDGTTRIFPNAVVRMSRSESAFWLSESNERAAPPEIREYFEGARKAAAPYVAAGRWQPFDGTAEILPGIAPQPEPGHTPGHTGYQIKSRGKQLLVTGDILHVEPVQFPRPSVTVAFDSDGAVAAQTRSAIFAEYARSGEALAGPHFPWPAIGHIRKDGEGYAWVPVIFSADVTPVD